MTARPTPHARRLAIIEDHELFAEALAVVFSLEGYDVRRIAAPSGRAGTGGVLAAARQLRPRVVLLDLDLLGFGDATPLIAPLARAGAEVVVLAGGADRVRWGGCLAEGARVVVSKGQTLDHVRTVVRRLLGGQPVLRTADREELLALWHEHRRTREEHQRRLGRLTPREEQVLGLLMEGRTVREIAHVAVVSEGTVRSHVKSVLAKLGVSSQLAAVGLAHESGWRPRG
ncbi:response regulator transcription factor [Nocardioides sp. SYSU DS0663]|uniref:response regulator transcription factor n=1 Tax=Nocardioides sp. SYSU DS0663 TaxID=3416445 RepID=UPI003F4B658B